MDEAASASAAPRASLDQLALLPAAALTLPDLLTRVAEYAVAAIPGAEGAGVTLMETGQPDVLAASAEFVAEVDAIQYGLGEGPCISAARERCTIRSGSLDETARWPTFSPRVVDLGVHSVLSLPLIVDEQTVGAINVYAHAPDAFSDLAQALGEQFARLAAVAAHNALVVHRTMHVAEQLQRALSERAVIDQAIGVLIAARGIDVDRARLALDAVSQSQGAPVAARVVADALAGTQGRSARSDTD
ncbi:MAG: GAF and ANTAR domain-containing protein [Jatrophihabitantaceae bacterium]